MSLRYIAASLGLSVTTVSRALAGYSDVAAETRARVKAEAERIGYVPNATARRLQKGRTDAIGVVVPAGVDAVNDSYLYTAFATAWARLSELDRDLVLLPSATGTGDIQSEIRSFQRVVEERRVDGLLLLRTHVNDWRIPYLQAAQLPFVIFGGEHPGLAGIVTVGTDNAEAARKVVGRLGEFGHRRLALVQPEGGFDFVASRVVRLEREAALHGIETVAYGGPFSEDGGRCTTRRILETSPIATGIVYLANRMAIGGLRAFAESPLVLGRHVSVIAFGDNANLRYASPPVTAVSAPVADMMRHAIDLLIAQHDKRPIEAIRSWPVSLIERQSDGPLVERPSVQIAPPGGET